MTAAPQAPSGQQAEPTDAQIRAGVRAFQSGHNGFDDLSDWRAFYRTVAALAGQQSERPAPAGHVVFREHRKAPDVEWAANIDIRNGAPVYFAAPAGQAVGEALKLAEEAINAIEDWAGYASDYFKQKHGYEAEIAEYRERLAALAASQAERPAVKEGGK